MMEFSHMRIACAWLQRTLSCNKRKDGDSPESDGRKMGKVAVVSSDHAAVAVVVLGASIAFSCISFPDI
jgi:hypothetical protein